MIIGFKQIYFFPFIILCPLKFEILSIYQNTFPIFQKNQLSKFSFHNNKKKKMIMKFKQMANQSI